MQLYNQLISDFHWYIKEGKNQAGEQENRVINEVLSTLMHLVNQDLQESTGIYMNHGNGGQSALYITNIIGD